jgi:hypothetical protein
MSDLRHPFVGVVMAESDTGIVTSMDCGSDVHDCYDDDEEEEVQVKEKHVRQVHEPAAYEAKTLGLFTFCYVSNLVAAPSTCSEGEMWHVKLYNFGPWSLGKRDTRLMSLQIQYYYDQHIQVHCFYSKFHFYCRRRPFMT